MPIYDQGYQRWTGEIPPRPARWWPIVRQGVMQFLPQRKYLTLLALAWLGPLFQGASLFTRLKGGDILENLLGQGRLDASSAFFWSAISAQGLWVVIFTIMVGSDLIASDRRFRALQLYFSKPITPNDYILGKLGVIAAFLLMTVWLPGLLLWLFGVMIQPTAEYLKGIWFVPFSLTVFTVLLVLLAGMLMLVMSSLGQRTVYIAGAWIIFFGFGPFQGIAELLKALSGQEYWGLVVLWSDLQQVGAWLFAARGPHDFHPVFSLLVVLGAIAACYAIVRRRIEPVEVVL